MALQQQLEMIERQRATMEAQVVCRIKHRKKAPEKKNGAFSNAKQKSRANS